jgi:hypothetical protein
MRRVLDELVGVEAVYFGVNYSLFTSAVIGAQPGRQSARVSLGFLILRWICLSFGTVYSRNIHE